MESLKKANDYESRCGWKYSFDFLEKIRTQCEEINEENFSIEAIETVLAVIEPIVDIEVKKLNKETL